MGLETNNNSDEKNKKITPTPEQIIEKVCKDKNELLKLSLNESLNNGIDIVNETNYNRWVKLLKENKIIDLSNTTFDDISKNGRSFAIKRVTPGDTFVTIFRGAPFSRFSIKGSYYTGGKIQDGGKFEINTIRDMNMSVLQISGDAILKDAETCKVPEKKESSRSPIVNSKEKPKLKKIAKKQLTHAKENILPDLDTLYTVQKGDTLWNIAKKFYPTSDNRELANIINALVRYNLKKSISKAILNDMPPPDGIKGDTIYTGKTIYIPTELKVLGKMINRFE